MVKPSIKKITIEDVARMAGYSKSTVSRVLRGETHYMRQETSNKVLQSIASLGYRPSSVARSLVSKRTHTVGLLVSDVGNPFYPEVIRGVEDMAFENGYHVFLCNTNYDLERSMTFIRSLVDRQVDGVLVMSSSVSDDFVNELDESRVPSVILDWQVDGAEGQPGNIGTILVNFESGIQAAVDYLADLGHHKFAHVSGPLLLRTSCTRRDIFLKALNDKGFHKNQAFVVEGNLRIDGGRRALADLLTRPEIPTAVFCANDLTAIGLVWAAREHGLRVPEDLSVVGLDDIQLASEMNPTLTTVSMPRCEIGHMAMKMLIRLLEKPETERDSILQNQVDTQLVIRQSTGPPDNH
jgi:LacI family transcriptional regulator